MSVSVEATNVHDFFHPYLLISKLKTRKITALEVFELVVYNRDMIDFNPMINTVKYIIHTLKTQLQF